MTRKQRGKPMNTPAKSDTKPLSMRDFEPSARGADVAREEAERKAMGIGDGRGRRKVGRTEPVSLKTFLHIKKMMLDMADAEEKSYTEVFEDAIQRRHEALKGKAR